MAFNPILGEPVPRWRQAQRRLGRNSIVLLKVFTAAIFLVTIVSISSETLVIRRSRLQAVAVPPSSEQVKTVVEAIRNTLDKQPSHSSPPLREDIFQDDDHDTVQDELLLPAPDSDESTRPILIKLMMLTSWDLSLIHI